MKETIKRAGIIALSAVVIAGSTGVTPVSAVSSIFEEDLPVTISGDREIAYKQVIQRIGTIDNNTDPDDVAVTASIMIGNFEADDGKPLFDEKDLAILGYNFDRVLEKYNLTHLITAVDYDEALAKELDAQGKLKLDLPNLKVEDEVDKPEENNDKEDEKENEKENEVENKEDEVKEDEVVDEKEDEVKEDEEDEIKDDEVTNEDDKEVVDEEDNEDVEDVEDEVELDGEAAEETDGEGVELEDVEVEEGELDTLPKTGVGSSALGLGGLLLVAEGLRRKRK